MSGEKRTPIQILQDEMRENRQQLYNVQKHREQLQRELSNVRQEHASQWTSLSVQMAERDQKQSAVVNSLQSDMREMCIRHSKQLSEQRKTLMNELYALESRTDKRIENVRSWASDQLEKQRGEYQRISQQQQKQINSIRQDIARINNREDNRENRAKVYLSDLELLIKFTDENLPHDRYAPGGLDKIKRQILAAKRQLSEDIPAATIATVQAAHFDLLDLQEEIQRKETEFEITYRTVADAIEALFNTVRHNRQIELEGSAVQNEADYWTQGRYKNLEERVQEIKDHIENDKDRLSTTELNSCLSELESLSQEQDRLIAEAVERIISSQLRAEMADIVIEKMEQQGFRIKNDERGYLQSDQRGPYIVKLANVAGTEIVTMISPEKKTYQNILSINTYNEDVYDDESRRLRNVDILQSLQEGGLKIGATQSYQNSVQEFYDVKSLIKKSGEKLPKQVLQRIKGLSSPESDSKKISQ